MLVKRLPRASAAIVFALGVVVAGPGVPLAAAQSADELQRQAATLIMKGRPREATRLYERALRADPNHVASLKDLAWLRATSSDPNLRRPAEAVRLAEKAFERMIIGFNSRRDRAAIPPGYDKLLILQVGASLGAAYGAAGRFQTPMDPELASLVASGRMNESQAQSQSASSGPLGADTVMQWAVDMAVAVEKQSPSPTTRKLVEDMQALARELAAGRPIRDGRPLPGTVRQ
jgi:tetratricopeptide (TPR) repeat protein